MLLLELVQARHPPGSYSHRASLDSISFRPICGLVYSDSDLILRLPFHLTHLMTAVWHATPWWAPWQELALGSYSPVGIPGETETAFERREERIARHVRDWIEAAEVRVSDG